MVQDANGPSISQYSSLPPFEGIYTGQCNQCGRKMETKEKFTSIMNVSLGVIEKWLGPTELKSKKNYIRL